MNKPFSLEFYKECLLNIQNQKVPFLTFKDFLEKNKDFDRFCLIRHDVDRKPKNALNMAILESNLGIKSTYYFRAKPCSFDIDIIKKINHLGHEIGYHYESLSDSKGNISAALKDFEINLNKFKKIVPIYTCSMHGRPFKPFDNRDIWRVKDNHQFLKEKLELLGEVYLDIDYNDIAYINDTGRNWTSTQSNRRDKVKSLINADFKNDEALIQYLQKNPHPKICFQIHPERWTNDNIDWMIQYAKDTAINIIKYLLSFTKK